MPTMHIPEGAWREIVKQEGGDIEEATDRVKEAVRREARGHE